MDEIQKTFTIQWVGPFHSLAEMNKYFQQGKQEIMSDPSVFSFYYFNGNKRGKGYKITNFYDYFGINKTFNVKSRLNTQHEHYTQFLENRNMEIWVGAFANPKDQTPHNIEDVETILISTYKPTENVLKKNRLLDTSMCIINLWYKPNETPWKRKPESVKHINDVLICEVGANIQRFLVGTLKEIKTQK